MVHSMQFLVLTKDKLTKDKYHGVYVYGLVFSWTNIDFSYLYGRVSRFDQYVYVYVYNMFMSIALLFSLNNILVFMPIAALFEK